jgi:hypothetical protein
MNFCNKCKGHISTNEYKRNEGKCIECVLGLEGGCTRLENQEKSREILRSKEWKVK